MIETNYKIFDVKNAKDEELDYIKYLFERPVTKLIVTSDDDYYISNDCNDIYTVKKNKKIADIVRVYVFKEDFIIQSEKLGVVSKSSLAYNVDHESGYIETPLTVYELTTTIDLLQVNAIQATLPNNLDELVVSPVLMDELKSIAKKHMAIYHLISAYKYMTDTADDDDDV